MARHSGPHFGNVGAVFIAAAVLCSAAPAFAQADAVERSKASFKAGATAYAAGEFLAAIQALESAYALTPIPAIAFSLAQAERKQYFVAHEREHLERAVTLLRRYIEQVPTGGRRADALDALAQLEPLLAASTGGATRASIDGDAVRRTRLMITSEAPGAGISIDGGPPVPSPLIREVTPGKHHVDITAEGFFPEQRELVALAGDLIPEIVTLRERPATVVVAAPGGSEIYVDGVYAGAGGDHVTLELPSGMHRMVVAESGYRVALRSLDLERGKTQTIRVELERTSQRKAAHVLFITGAGALAAGAVFGALAVRAEDQAQDFLAQKAQGNVSAEALAEYDDDVAARERYRIATAVSLASSLGLFITGFFLHELDRPAPEELRRRAAQPGRHTARIEPSLRVAPVAAPTGLGISLRGAF
jgi:hypothetical protein